MTSSLHELLADGLDSETETRIWRLNLPLAIIIIELPFLVIGSGADVHSLKMPSHLQTRKQGTCLLVPASG